MKILIIVVFVIIILLFSTTTSRTYTDQEWDEQCKRDFEKYGPVPDDEI